MKFAALLLLIVSCASAPMTETEKSVRILRQSDPEKKCKELGQIYAGGMTADQESDDVKRKTAEKGGDTAQINRRDEYGTVYATAFKCNA